jgi:hypothetical protein
LAHFGFAPAQFQGKINLKFDRMNYGCPEAKIIHSNQNFMPENPVEILPDQIRLCMRQGQRGL